MSEDKIFISIRKSNIYLDYQIRGSIDTIAEQIAEKMSDNDFIVFDLYKGGKLILNKANIVWLEIKIPPTS